MGFINPNLYPPIEFIAVPKSYMMDIPWSSRVRVYSFQTFAVGMGTPPFGETQPVSEECHESCLPYHHPNNQLPLQSASTRCEYALDVEAMRAMITIVDGLPFKLLTSVVYPREQSDVRRATQRLVAVSQYNDGRVSAATWVMKNPVVARLGHNAID